MGGREARASVTLPLTLLCFAAPGLAEERARDYPIDPFTAIPYSVWSHSGEDQMEVWIPQRVNLDLRIP